VTEFFGHAVGQHCIEVCTIFVGVRSTSTRDRLG
jgi:hypothetical protein